MSDIDLENWDPAEPATLESMLKNVSPYRVDDKAIARRAKAEPARSRRFECPGCGILKNVEPIFSGSEWHYIGLCSHCGASWVNAYHLMVVCDKCDKKNPITSRNPNGWCNCEGDKRGTY